MYMSTPSSAVPLASATALHLSRGPLYTDISLIASGKGTIVATIVFSLRSPYRLL